MTLTSLALGQVASVVVLSATPGAIVQGQNVTFTAGVPWTVPAAPATGTITVMDQCPGVMNPTMLGTITLDSFGQGTLQASNFPCVGTNAIVATYSDDSNYMSGTSLPLIVTVLPQGTPTSTMLSSSLNFSSTEDVAFDAALSYSGDCPFTIAGPSGSKSSVMIEPQGIALASTPGPHDYVIDFAGSGVILPDAGTFTYDPSNGFSNFHVQWFGATFDFTALANNALGCGTSGPALGFALLKQSLNRCPSGKFASYVWNGTQVGEGAAYTFSFSYPNPQFGLTDIALNASASCPTISCGHTLANGTWTIRDASTPPTPTVSCPTANSGVVGSSFSSPALSVTGGTPPYTFKVVGTLPDGLSMDAFGAITGTATDGGAFSIEAIDANGVVARNSVVPHGIVTFKDTNTGNVLGSASIATSGSGGMTKTGASFRVSPLPAGSYAVQAAYSGDSVYAASTSSILNQVAQQSAGTSTTTTLNADATQITAGQSIALTALVNSGGSAPTGTVTFSDGTNLLGALALDATGRATLNVSLSAGAHAIVAAYGGDAFSASSTSATVNVNVQAAPANATTTTLNFYPAIDGANFVLVATVTSPFPGAPTGTVTFQDASTIPPSLGTATVQNGVAAITVPLTAGTHPLSASYSGDDVFAASAGTVAGVVSPLGLPSTMTSISSSANPAAYGQVTSFTATVSGSSGTPTGTMTFNTGSMVTSVGLDSFGKATFTTAALPVGDLSVSAIYSGDANNTGSTALFAQTLNPASTATALTVSTSVIFTATVSVIPPGAGVPTGTVSFVTDNSQAVCSSVPLEPDGTAICAPSGPLTVGSITAAYSGDANFLPSSGLIVSTQTIGFAAPSDRPFGSAPFALNATASSGLPVSFASNSTDVCTVAGVTVTLVAAGTCNIQATQAGNSFYSAAQPVNQSLNVTQASQTISFPPPGNQVLTTTSFNLNATATSGLTVSFTSSTTAICTVSGAIATLLAAGACTIQAMQAGNSNYSAAPPVSQSFTVSKASQTINFPTPSNQLLTTVSFTLSATASSGLTVSFTSSTTTICTVSGATVTLVAAGTCTIQASQPGDATYLAASAVTRSFTVSKANQTITFATPPNQVLTTVSFTLTATASSGLTVSFTSSTTTICTVSGATVTLVAAGTCTIQATQPGNAIYLAATAVTRSFTVSKASQTITFATLANQTLGSAPFTVSATASSGLTVSFTSTTTAVCTVSGTTVTLIAAGTCTIQATQAGNATYLAAPSVSRSFTVAKQSQTITFAALANQTLGSAPFTLSATASSGLTVSFTSTTTRICTVSGVTVTLVAAGTCTIQANQAGNANYAAAPAVSRSFTVAKQNQTITFAALANQALGSPPFALSATASSGLTVTFTSSTTRICTVSGVTVTLVAAGTCTIQANQAGNANYAAAPVVSQSFTVTGPIVTFTLPRLTTSPANTNTKTGTVTVSNAATATGSITFTADPTITKVGTAGGIFSILTGGTCWSGVVVNPGGSCTISVQYAPGTSTSTATANVTITVTGLGAPTLTSSNFTAN